MKKKAVKRKCNSSDSKSIIVNKIKSNIKANSAVEKIKDKRLKYTKEALNQALEAIKSGLSARKAASLYNVPQSTLSRRLRKPEVGKSGPPTVLSTQMEKRIVDWVLYRSKHGHPVTANNLKDCIKVYVSDMKLQTPFTNDRPGRKWFDAFCKRHPILTLRTPQHLEKERASVTEENLRGWFKEVEEHLASKNLINIDPSRVFNCDETNVLLVPKGEKVLTTRGVRTVYKIMDGQAKESVTALLVYGANGVRAPPMVMYPYKLKVPSYITEKCPKDWGCGISESGIHSIIFL